MQALGVRARACVAGLIAVVAMVVTMLASGAGPAAGAPTPAAGGAPPAIVGVHVHLLWGEQSDTDRMKVLFRIRATGADTVRVDLGWSSLQPTSRNRFDPGYVAFVDKWFGVMRQLGLRPLAAVWLAPSWSNDGQGPRYLPRDPADYARVMAWLVNRYRGMLAGVQVWNEPNLPTMLAPAADPVAYVRLLRSVWRAVKQTDSRVPVVFGGLSTVDTDWMAHAYAAGARGWFDVMAVNPYMSPADTDPGLPDNGSPLRMAHVLTLRRLMTAWGNAGTPIWFTELGWSTHLNQVDTPGYARGVSESAQAAYFARTVTLAQAWGVARLYWYQAIDTSAAAIDGDPQALQNSNYGLLRADLTTKPAYGVLWRVNGGL